MQIPLTVVQITEKKLNKASASTVNLTHIYLVAPSYILDYTNVSIWTLVTLRRKHLCMKIYQYVLFLQQIIVAAAYVCDYVSRNGSEIYHQRHKLGSAPLYC
jgi:hypothetical protein